VSEAESHPYPVVLEGELDSDLSRWLWLVKWLLVIPHLIVLAFLWLATLVCWLIALFAILFTGRYPRGLFDFVLGVLRWTWRVAFYSYYALGTDRYPPFSLEDDPGYPAHFEVAYPEHLSRGLVLVKWWLLAIPHYIIVGLFVGGLRIAIRSETWSIVSGGLIGILVLVAGLMLAFTARYPTGLFDLVMGLNRWVLRVGAYVGLMTDRYPPFKLEMGGADPAGTLTVPPHSAPAPLAIDRPTAWTGGRIASAIVGSIMIVVSLGLFAGGGTLLWADRADRNAAGFISAGPATFGSSAYAITSEKMSWLGAPSWLEPSSILGTVRVSVTAVDPPAPVFVGVAAANDVDAYLASVSRAVVGNFAEGTIDRSTIGERAPAAPAAQRFWVASTVGSGTQVLDWKPDQGAWTVVVMNADARPGVSVRAEAGATFPPLGAIATGLLVAGGVALIGGALFVLVAVSRSRTAAPQPTPPLPPVV
jgi:uncharacterized protein DUF4389